jgi:predicted transcriptional regulator
MLLFLFLFFIGLVTAQNSSIYGNVVDRDTAEPIEDVQVELTYYDNQSVLQTTFSDSQGYYELVNLYAGDYRIKANATNYRIDFKVAFLEENQSLEVNFRLHYDDQSDEAAAIGYSEFPMCFQALMLLVIILVISLSLYSKIKRENLLNNAIRNRIYQHIKENPGKHYRAILKDLDLPMGVLTYHINRLEKAQYLNSRQDGMYRRFYVKGPKTDMKFLLSDVQKSILNVIKENRGISQTKIADRIGVSRKVVNYHVNILRQAGFIMVESNGRETACYIVGS